MATQVGREDERLGESGQEQYRLCRNMLIVAQTAHCAIAKCHRTRGASVPEPEKDGTNLAVGRQARFYCVKLETRSSRLSPIESEPQQNHRWPSMTLKLC